MAFRRCAQRHRRLKIAIAAVLGVGIALAVPMYVVPLLAIGTAYKAKILCSGVFISKRDARSILDGDLAVDDLALLRIVRARVDLDARAAEADVLGLVPRKAVFRDGAGCAIAPEGTKASASAGSVLGQPLPEQFDPGRWREVLDSAFTEPDPRLPRRTRAVVIVHKGRVVAERYAAGFTKDTPLLGWSMTKSVMNALVGSLVKEGEIALDEPAAVPQWQKANDPRGKITIGQLLHMTSGLKFDEDYANPLSDVTYMLLGVPDAAAYALAKPLEASPGARWRYSSGTTNVLAYAVRRRMNQADYLQFPKRALFDRIGMTSAVLEADAAGTFVASSFMYATARDWARFGLLYLQDGVWSGERILPQGWVAYTRTPVPSAPGGQYGAHFWLRIPKEYRCGSAERPLPDDAFHAIGHEGQFVTIVPSRELVLVRLGLTRYPCAWDHATFVRLALDNLEAR
jgi:CubicO group peptidase (beta-lactamase class C family)